MNPRDLLLVIYLESNGNPSARKSSTGATGLIQFMPDTLKGMGVPKNEVATFGQKSAEDQLDYVKQYVKGHQSLIGGKPFTSATQYYVANFFPIALKRWDGSNPVANKNVVVVDSKSSDPRERAAYKANPILDYNKDGKITVGDITNNLMKLESNPKFQQLQSNLNAVAGQGQVSEVVMQSKKPQTEPQELSQDQKGLLAKFIGGVEKLLASAGAQPNPIIVLSSNSDFCSELEYARIFSMAVEEELNRRAHTYTNGKKIEIQCDFDPTVLAALCDGVSDAFFTATKKIGGVKISHQIINGHPKYDMLSVDTAETNYRKFHLKFALNKEDE